MSNQRPSESASLPLSSVKRIDERCSQFESQWKGGQQPKVKDYLDDLDGPAYDALLRELLFIDIAYRQRNGETPKPADYLPEFAEADAVIDSVFREVSKVSEVDTSNLGSCETGHGHHSASGEVPKRIGRYEPIKKLGEGAFGTVYLARDEQLGRQVAIKVLHADWLTSSKARLAFEREAKLAANLKHPSIVTIYDFGRLDGGEPFFVMEHIEGQSLDQLVESTKLEPTRAAEMFGQIADAIAFAHDRGLVHRDIKPANILVDEKGVPHVTDFGLALQKDRQRWHDGEISGTAAYMSPEQVRGDASQLDACSDIWGLGVVLYEMLTGERPFKNVSREALFDEILQQDPVPPCKLDNRIPEEFDRICLKCLQKDASNRFADAKDLSDAIRRVYPDELVEGNNRSDDSITNRLYRMLAIAVAAVLVGLLVIVIASNPSDSVEGRAANGDDQAVAESHPPNAALLKTDNPVPGQVKSSENTKTLTDATFTLSSGKQFSILSEAVNAANDGDTIDVQGDVAELDQCINTHGKALRIRAVSGASPKFLLTDSSAMAAIRTSSRLVLEGLTFERTASVGQVSIIRAQEPPAAIHATNCRFIYDTNRRASCVVSKNARECSLTNCEFYSGTAAGVHWFPIRDGNISFSNCVHQGATFCMVGPVTGEENHATVNMADCTVFGRTVARVLVPILVSEFLPHHPIVNFKANGCAFRVESVLQLRTIPIFARDLTPEVCDWVDWRHQRSLFAVSGKYLSEGEHWDLASWNKLWDLKDTGSEELEAKLPDIDILEVPRELSPSDFEISLDASMTNNKSNVAKGASLVLVGPGKAYHDWKQTEEYVDWMRLNWHGYRNGENNL